MSQSTQSDEWTVIDHTNDNEQTAESRDEAEQKAETAREFGSENVEIIPPGETDGGTHAEADVPATEVVDAEPATDDLPDDPSIDRDPVDWLPGHFIDDIQGVPTVNRKGYAVIASKYGISVRAEPVTLPSETGFEYAEFTATAETPDGETYTGFGSAHIDRQDGDDAHLLGELAETRAMKRAVAWASGVGLTAAEEMMGGLE
jgi:hypothetical protein